MSSYVFPITDYNHFLLLLPQPEEVSAVSVQEASGQTRSQPHLQGGKGYVVVIVIIICICMQNNNKAAFIYSAY